MYPASPGFVAGSATSKASADALQPRLSTMQTVVLGLFQYAGAYGLTDADLQALTVFPSPLRPRRCELVELGKLKDSGTTRKGPSGKEMTVWILA